MAPSPEDKRPTSGPGHDCGQSANKRLDASCVCHTVDPVAVSKCWPGVGSHTLEQDVPDTQIAPADNCRVFNISLKVDHLLPDTQRNSTDSQATSQIMTAVLHQLGDALPTTQRNVLDSQDTLVAPADSQLLDNQRSVFQSTQKNESLHAQLEQLLPDTPTQILDREYALGTTVGGSDSQLSDTQRNECSRTGTDEFIDDNQDLRLPDTQRNTPQLGSPLRSPTILAVPNYQNTPLGVEGLLLPDTQRNNDGPEAIYPTPNTSILLTQTDKIITDTQVSSSDNPEVPNLADIPFLNTGICLKSSQSAVPKVPYNKVTCRERKRIIISPNRPPALTKAMCQWVDSTNYLLDPFREADECWFHPSPPPARLSMNGILRPCGKLQKRFNWKDRHGKHSLVLNFGIASKVVNYKMTKQQKDGFINKQWHLSHLCGNWTCLNPAHTTVEPGNVNISRNNCFSHRSGCLHNPPCMKDKKVPLGADGKLVDHTASISSNIGPIDAGDWDDWSIQGFDDGNDFIMMDDNEDSETTAYHNGGDSFVIIDDDEDEL